MSKMISKTLNITRVAHQTVAVNNGVPEFVPHPDAVFPGQLDEAKVKKLLQARYGKDAILVVTKIDAGQYRFAMPLETFVQYAIIADGGADEGDPNDEASEGEVQAGSNVGAGMAENITHNAAQAESKEAFVSDGEIRGKAAKYPGQFYAEDDENSFESDEELPF